MSISAQPLHGTSPRLMLVDAQVGEKFGAFGRLGRGVGLLSH